MLVKKLISALCAAAVIASSFTAVVSADETLNPIVCTQSASFLTDGDGRVTQTIVNHTDATEIKNISWNNTTNSYQGVGVLEFTVPAVNPKKVKSAELSVSVHNGSDRSGARTYDVYASDITINQSTTATEIKQISLAQSIYTSPVGVSQGETRTDKISGSTIRDYVKSRVNEGGESKVQFAFSNSNKVLDIDPATATLSLVLYENGVALDETELTLTTASAPHQLTYSVFGGIDENTLEWSSKNDEIATVSNKGLVTPHKAGKTVITVKTQDGSFSAECAVTVNQAAERLVMDKDTLALMAGGRTGELTARLQPDGVVNRKITWTSSEENVATVSDNGIVTPIAAGQTTITATSADNPTCTATCSVTVTDLITAQSVTLDKTEISLPKLGATYSLHATVAPEGADDRITWTTDNADTAQVIDGVVISGNPGTAKITATTQSGQSAECSVTVTDDKQLITNDHFYTDTEGKPIFSQGGGIFKFGDTYYWYGVRYKESMEYVNTLTCGSVEHPQLDAFTCYTSKDLVNWKYEGDVATAATLGTGCYWGGRCGVMYDARRNSYALVSQYDGDMTASADNPLGPFKIDKQYFWGTTPGITNNQTGDLTVFYDEDGAGYIICSSANGRANLYVIPITQDENGKYDFDSDNKKTLGGSTSNYYDEDGTVKTKDKGGIEGDCMFKYKGHYYFTGSDLYGWHGSRVYVFESDNGIKGDYSVKPDYVTNPSGTNLPYIMPGVKNNYAHNSQTGFYYTLHGSEQELVIYCGDRWTSFDNFGIGFNQWVPLTMDGYTPHFNDLSQWRLDAEKGTWTIGDGNNYLSNPAFNADRVSVGNIVGWEGSDSLGGGAVGNIKTTAPYNGAWSAKHQANDDYTATLKQTVKDLPDGTYTLRASVKSSGGQNECILYANAGDKKYTASAKNGGGQWETLVISDIEIKDGECEVGLYSDTVGGKYAYIDDMFLTRNYDGTVIDGKPNTNVPDDPPPMPPLPPLQPRAMMASVSGAWYSAEDGMNFRLTNANKYDKVTAYVAEYENDALISVETKEITAATAKEDIKIDYARKSDTSELKLLIWHDMIPAAEAVTVTATEYPYKFPEGYTSYFKFDGDLTDSKTSAQGTLTSEKITSGTAAPSAASYDDNGYNGKAVKFTGAGSYGINLGKVITNEKYTVAFRMKANVFTQHTSGIFINSGSTDPNENWLSAPFGPMTGGGTTIWSRKQPASHHTLENSTGQMKTDTWHHIAIAVDGKNASLYIDGEKTGSGTVENTVDANTETYLGVNYWDTPFNGLIDDLYIYNGTTLTDEQVTGLFEATTAQ